MAHTGIDNQVLVETRGLTKAFSGVTVLHDISVRIPRGAVFGIVGENGAGKSTFTKLLNGTHLPTAGHVLFEGRELRHLTVQAAQRCGISTIPQEFNLIEDLTVYENIFLGRELRRFGLLDRGAMRRRASELLNELESGVSPDSSIRDLSVAGRQMVEIAKTMVTDCRLLIMDEPTTVLNQNEIGILFALMRRLRERGTTIIYISHKLREVKQICDEVMVLRDGSFISVDPIGAVDEAEMARRMVGREMTQMFPVKGTPSPEVALSVEGLCVPGVLQDVSFSLHRGEVLGFAGLVGAGRTELAETLIGVRHRSRGRVGLFGEEVEIRSPAQAVRCGIAYLSEDRQGTGIHTDFSVIHNVTMISLRKYCRILIRGRAEAERASYYVDAFNIKTESLRTRLEHLSGGNQQKVALAKELDTEPAIFIFDEPTRGIDIKAKSEIYAFVRHLVEQGIACIVISSDLEEVIGLCDRVAVMRAGHLAGILSGDRICEEEIMYLATGVK